MRCNIDIDSLVVLHANLLSEKKRMQRVYVTLNICVGTVGVIGQWQRLGMPSRESGLNTNIDGLLL